MRNLIFRVLAGLLGISFIGTFYISVLNAEYISILLLISVIYSLIFALGGYKAIEKTSLIVEAFSHKILSFSKKAN
jgi:hypothetical protein